VSPLLLQSVSPPIAGQVLTGNRLAESVFPIQFKRNVEDASACSLTLTTEDILQLQSAIEEFYYFELLFDGLPVYNFLGDYEEMGLTFHSHRFFFFAHYHFTFGFNGNQIVLANVSMIEKPPVDITVSEKPITIPVTFSVSWIESDIPFSQRMAAYESHAFFPRVLEVHWLSIVNSIVLVIMLTGTCVLAIL
jgi:transmembrane 9 superfamily member 1